MASKPPKLQANPHLGLLNRPWADPNPGESLGLPVMTGQFRLVIEAARLLFVYHERCTAWHFSPGIGQGQLGQWWHPEHAWLTVMAGRPQAASQGDPSYAGRLADMWLKEGCVQPVGPLVPREEDRLAAFYLPKAPSDSHAAEWIHPTPLTGVPVCWADEHGQELLPGLHRPARTRPERLHRAWRQMTFLEQWFPWLSEPHRTAPPAARSRHKAFAERLAPP